MFISFEWINKIWYIHTMKYYSTIKRNEVLIDVTTWMYPETSMLLKKKKRLMLCERSHIQKAIYC